MVQSKEHAGASDLRTFFLRLCFLVCHILQGGSFVGVQCLLACQELPHLRLYLFRLRPSLLRDLEVPAQALVGQGPDVPVETLVEGFCICPGKCRKIYDELVIHGDAPTSSSFKSSRFWPLTLTFRRAMSNVLSMNCDAYVSIK